MGKPVENKPTANVLMNSMRCIGYSFETAIADVIDNSISAFADLVELKFPIDPLSVYIAICDNGIGMTKEELFDAMKYGSTLKGNHRSENDLGRFGLGLKSASLSQCRKLTVASKRNGILSAYVWDLDVVKDKEDWMMLELSADEIQEIKHIDFLENRETGTVVVWEDFDLIRKSSGNEYGELVGRQTSTADYLSLIFHRYLNRDTSRKLTIKINEYELEGFDPFLENHPKTSVRKKLSIPLKDNEGIERFVTVQPFILPFQKDLSEEDKKLSGGLENYRTKQGFYIYRNERLIVWGNWFGRAHDELTKYARIRVDIPNTLDDIWGIDVKKQTAIIPASIRQRLTHAVDDAMDVAVKKQTYRGRTAKIDDKIDYIWSRTECRDNQFEYKINRNSKIFDLIKDKIDGETLALLNTILEEIENNIPYQQIYIDKSRNVIDDEPTKERIADVENLAKLFISYSVKNGGDVNESIDRLFTSEPFSKFPELKEKLKETNS